MTAEDGRRVHYVSSGSAGKSKDGDLRACWVELVLGAEAEVRAAASDDAAAGQGRGRSHRQVQYVHDMISRVPARLQRGANQ